MNGTDFLADTNALIYLLDGNSCMSPFFQIRQTYWRIVVKPSLIPKNIVKFKLKDFRTHKDSLPQNPQI